MNQNEFASSLSAEQNVALITFRDSINAQRDSASQLLVVEHARLIAESESAIEKLSDDLALAKIDRDTAKQEVVDIYELLGANPNIAAIKKQQAIAKVESEIAEAIKRKDDLFNPKAVDASVEAYKAPE